MSRRILFLPTLLSLFIGVNLDARILTGLDSATASQADKGSRTKLRLGTEIIKETYCDGPDPDLLAMRLLLRLSFTNVGDQRIILERNSNQIPLVRISKTTEDAASDRVEMVINNHIITSEESEGFPAAPGLNRFVFLDPHDTYRTLATVDLPVPRSKPITEAIPPGIHYMQIAVWTWSDSQANARLARNEWRRYGFLWTETILSDLMALTIAVQPNPVDCRCKDPKTTEVDAIRIAARKMNAGSRRPDTSKPFAIPQNCEWYVIFPRIEKRSRNHDLIYVIDKVTGKIVAELK